MEKLQAACKPRGFFMGMDIDPKREAKNCTVDPPDIILFIANGQPAIANIILSDTVTESLSISAEHLLDNVREYKIDG